MKIFLKTILSLFLLIFLVHCSSNGSTNFIITSVSWKNPNLTDVQCREVFSKRVYYFPYVIPLNKIDKNDLKDIGNEKSLMYSQGLQGLDLVYTILGAAFGLIVQTQMVEACDVIMAEQKKEAPNKKSCYYDHNFKKIFCKNNNYYDKETEYNIGVFERLFMLY